MDSMSAPGRPASRWMVLTLSTIAFTLLFNVWLMIGVLGPKLRDSLGLSASQVEWLIATAILAGSLPRLNFGVWADRYGGRKYLQGFVAGSELARSASGLPTFARTLARNG